MTVAWVALVVAAASLAIACAAPCALGEETEMTGGFVPVALDAGDGGGGYGVSRADAPSGGSRTGDTTGRGEDADGRVSGVDAPSASETDASEVAPASRAGRDAASKGAGTSTVATGRGDVRDDDGDDDVPADSGGTGTATSQSDQENDRGNGGTGSGAGDGESRTKGTDGTPSATSADKPASSGAPASGAGSGVASGDDGRTATADGADAVRRAANDAPARDGGKASEASGDHADNADNNDSTDTEGTPSRDRATAETDMSDETEMSVEDGTETGESVEAPTVAEGGREDVPPSSDAPSGTSVAVVAAIALAAAGGGYALWRRGRGPTSTTSKSE